MSGRPRPRHCERAMLNNFAFGEIAPKAHLTRRTRQSLPLLWFLCSVFASFLLSSFNSGGVQHSSYNMITHSGQILYSAASYHNNRMLLQIMPYSGDISGCFHSIAQPHARDLAHRGIWFSWICCKYFQAHSALKRRWIFFWLILQNIKAKTQSNPLCGFFGYFPVLF